MWKGHLLRCNGNSIRIVRLNEFSIYYILEGKMIENTINDYLKTTKTEVVGSGREIHFVKSREPLTQKGLRNGVGLGSAPRRLVRLG